MNKQVNSGYPTLGWLIPAATVTALVLAAAWLLVPHTGYTAPPPVTQFVSNWFLLMTILGAFWFTFTTIVMFVRRVPSPIRVFIKGGREHAREVAIVVFGFLLTGAIQLGFNWVKPQLAILFPFWADPMLASFDHLLFGADPWQPLRHMLGDGVQVLDYVYSLWYPVTLFALFGVLLARRQQAILAYFLLWGVFGTVMQALFSAAGPIFWRRIGLGDRFDALVSHLPMGTRGASEYLWMNHTMKINDIAVGISAMPSMHVAMACWIAIAYARTRFALLGFAYWALVFLGSVALGWHYFADGLVGTAGALVCFWIAGVIVNLPHPRAKARALPANDPGMGQPAPSGA